MAGVETWGTVSSWVGSLLTSGSLLLGFSILRNDKRAKLEAQARQLSVIGIDEDERTRRYAVTNHSPLPIRSMQVVVLKPTTKKRALDYYDGASPRARTRWVKAVVKHPELHSRPSWNSSPGVYVDLKPGEGTDFVVRKVDPFRESDNVVMVIFSDAAGLMWLLEPDLLALVRMTKIPDN